MSFVCHVAIIDELISQKVKTLFLISTFVDKCAVRIINFIKLQNSHL